MEICLRAREAEIKKRKEKVGEDWRERFRHYLRYSLSFSIICACISLPRRGRTSPYQEVSGRGQNRGISPLSLPLLLILFQKIFDCDPTSLLLANHLLEKERVPQNTRRRQISQPSFSLHISLSERQNLSFAATPA